ncbi:hypothetical protein C8Q79DRAFT_926645 [Trametes meyenii]|nr:hypothetical protein C8Q79DRAFT_926645 [Trametes meyenii]
MPFRLFRCDALSDAVAFDIFNGVKHIEKSGPYAILSHVWDEAVEQSYENVVALIGNRATYEDPSLNEKVRKCASLAIRHGLVRFWIDAPCIDKRNSTELGEALSSMYDWYSNAKICFAHLPDVPSYDDISQPNSAFRQSVYFTRGWTLQELIAPKRVVFLAKDWTPIGEKTGLANLLQDITGIDVDVLTHRRPVVDVSVARRFSWASRRKTTLLEDEAYCLMGLFGVRMQMDYGEGHQAFFRLQKKILEEVCDHTLFCWGIVQDMPPPIQYNTQDASGQPTPVPAKPGLFASSPAAFGRAARMAPVNTMNFISAMEGFGVVGDENGYSHDPLPRFLWHHHGLECRLPVIYRLRDATPIAAILASQDDAGSYIALALRSHGPLNLLHSVFLGEEPELAAPTSDSNSQTEAEAPRLLRVLFSNFLKPPTRRSGSAQYHLVTRQGTLELPVGFKTIHIVASSLSPPSPDYSNRGEPQATAPLVALPPVEFPEVSRSVDAPPKAAEFADPNAITTAKGGLQANGTLPDVRALPEEVVSSLESDGGTGAITIEVISDKASNPAPPPANLEQHHLEVRII